MALTPQNNDAFLREVDENLRRDQMIGAARRWGLVVAAVVAALLMLLAGVLLWRNHRRAQAERAAETLGVTLAPLENGQPVTGSQSFASMAAGGAQGYSTAARFAIAAEAIRRGDSVGAAGTLSAIANDADVPQPQRDLALVRATALDYDRLRPEHVIERLKGMAVQGHAFFPSAGEMTAHALLKLGRTAKAAQLFAALAESASAPVALRARAAGMATTLGHAVRQTPGQPL